MSGYLQKRVNTCQRELYTSPRKMGMPYIEWQTTSTFTIEPQGLSDNRYGFVANFPNYQQNLVIPPWTMDFSQSIIDTSERTGGVIDQLGSIYPANFYMLFAILKEANTNPYPEEAAEYKRSFAGFGLWKQPKSATTAISGTGAKGSEISCTLNAAPQYHGHQFTIGARVLVGAYTTGGILTSFNTGKIQDIISPSQVEIVLDNIPSGLGTTINTELNHWIVQLDRFRPYDIGDVGVNYSDNYQLVAGGFYIYNNEEESNDLLPFSYDRGYWTHQQTRQMNSLSVSASCCFGTWEYVPPTATEWHGILVSDQTGVQLRNIYSFGVYLTTNENCYEELDVDTYPLVTNMLITEETTFTVDHYQFVENII